MTVDAAFSICATCAVEHAGRPEVCAICADERQWVPAGGQRWTTLGELAAAGHRTVVTELEPGLLGIEASPAVGIGQQAKAVGTPEGVLLWDPIGFVDDEAVRRIRALGEVVAIAASHPHMFGVQVEWSRALGGPPVLVAEADLGWVARPDPVVRAWSGTVEVLPGVTLSQPGGPFPGSYPNHLPLSAAVTERVAGHIERLAFDRLYGNFTNVIDSDAREVVRRSAARHIAWVRGDLDHLT